MNFSIGIDTWRRVNSSTVHMWSLVESSHEMSRRRVRTGRTTAANCGELPRISFVLQSLAHPALRIYIPTNFGATDERYLNNETGQYLEYLLLLPAQMPL